MSMVMGDDQLGMYSLCDSMMDLVWWGRQRRGESPI